MAEHTPFPWEGHGYIVFSPDNGVVCEMSEPHPVRMVTHYDQDRTPHEVEFHPLEHNEVALGSKSRDEVAANKALILAIPDLLAACEELVESWEMDTYIDKETLRLAKVAIAKAKGSNGT